MKPKIKFEVGTVGPEEYLAYIMTINSGWYTTGKLITPAQRKMLIKRPVLRQQMKWVLEKRFWRYIGAA